MLVLKTRAYHQVYFYCGNRQRANQFRKVKCLLTAAIMVLGWSASAPGQTFTDFQIPTANSQPNQITVGPDGNLWFTESGSNQIGRITTAGTITEFPVPTINSGPNGITAGADGNLWFTELSGNKIGRIK